MKFDLRVDKDSLAGVHYLVKKLKNPKDLLTDIGELIVEDIKQRIINTKLDIFDKPYAPWAPSTKKARQQKGNAALGILYDSGNLVSSINYKVSGSRLQVGTPVPYATYLNEGTNNMPARQFMGISNRARQGINDTLKSYFGDNK